jgi:hypothetical protein
MAAAKIPALLNNSITGSMHASISLDRDPTPRVVGGIEAGR